jgi:hypothetical protein
MTIRFATASCGYSSVIARAVSAPMMYRPANDNLLSENDDSALWEALRHFARHGLRAAARAAEAAETALEAGDRESFEWWLEVCGKIDPSLSEALARKAGLTA